MSDMQRSSARDTALEVLMQVSRAMDLLFDMIKIVWSLPEESDDHKAVCDVSL